MFFADILIYCGNIDWLKCVVFWDLVPIDIYSFLACTQTDIMKLLLSTLLLLFNSIVIEAYFCLFEFKMRAIIFLYQIFFCLLAE